jgi:hypothetical protein
VLLARFDASVLCPRCSLSPSRGRDETEIAQELPKAFHLLTNTPSIVIAGPDPAIHPFIKDLFIDEEDGWMPGSGPGMTIDDSERP